MVEGRGEVMSASVDEMLSRVRRTPDDAEAYCALGRAFEAESRFAAAFQSYAAAMEKDANHAPAAFHMGMMLFMAGEYEDAAAMLGHSLELDPDNAVGWNNLGVALEFMGQPQSALTAFTEAYAFDATMDEPPIHMARLRFALGDIQGALDVLDEIKHLESSRVDVCVLRVSTLSALRRFEEAATLADLMVGRFPGEARALSVAGQLRLLMGDVGRASELFDDALAVDEGAYDALIGVGSIALDKGDVEKARLYFERATRADDARFEPYLYLCTIAFDKSDFRALARWSAEGLERAPIHSGLLFFSSIVMRNAGNNEGAEKSLKLIIETNPAYQPARFGLAKIYLDFYGDDQLARPHLEESIRIDENSNIGQQSIELLNQIAQETP